MILSTSLLWVTASCTGASPPPSSTTASIQSTGDTSISDTSSTDTAPEETIRTGWLVWDEDRVCWAVYVDDLPASIWGEWNNQSCNSVLDSTQYPPNTTRYWMTNLNVCAEFNEPLEGECAVDVDYFEPCDAPSAGPCCDLPETTTANQCHPDPYFQP